MGDDVRDGDPVFCHDCGVDMQPLDDYGYGIPGTSEYSYMVLNEVWEAANGPKEDYPKGMLCIGCLEARLGRKLTRKDFKWVPLTYQTELDTPRLAARKRTL